MHEQEHIKLKYARTGKYKIEICTNRKIENLNMHEQDNGEAQQNDVWVHIEKVFMKIVNIIDIKIIIFIIYVFMVYHHI